MNIQSIFQNYDVYIDSSALLSGLANAQAKVFFEKHLVFLLKKLDKKIYITRDFDNEIQQTVLSGSARSKYANMATDIVKSWQEQNVVEISNQNFFTITKQANGRKKQCIISNMPKLGSFLVNALRNNKKLLSSEQLDSLLGFKFNRHGEIEAWFNPTNNDDYLKLDYTSLEELGESTMKSKGLYLSDFAKDHLIFFDSTSLLASLNHETYKSFYMKDLAKILKETDQKLYISKNLLIGLERAVELLNQQMGQEQNLSQGSEIYAQRLEGIQKAFKFVNYFVEKGLAINVEQSFEEMMQNVISYERPAIFVVNNPQTHTQLQNILKNASQTAKEEVHLAKIMKSDGSLDVLSVELLDQLATSVKKKPRIKEENNNQTAEVPKLKLVSPDGQPIEESIQQNVLSSIVPPETSNSQIVVTSPPPAEPVLATQSVSIRDLIKYFKLFFDTSALVHSARTYHTQSFLTQELPYALHQTNNKAIIPLKVLDEIEKLTKHTDIQTRQNAQKILTIVQMYLASGVAELKGEELDTFPDHIFQVIFTRYRLTHNLLLITNDHNLAIDLLNINNSLAVLSHKNIKLFRFVDSPPDIIKDWQEILHGDPKLRLINQNQTNLSIFNIQTNKDNVYRTLKKQATNWNSID